MVWGQLDLSQQKCIDKLQILKFPFYLAMYDQSNQNLYRSRKIIVTSIDTLKFRLHWQHIMSV